MAATYQLQVITPERIILDEEIQSLVAPGAKGYLGVLANHAPLLTSLVEGNVQVRKPDGSESLYRIDGGFLEVADNQAVILADHLEGME